MSTELTTEERGALAGYEAIIQSGLDSFIEVGTALARINEARLYRETHKSFDEYVRQRWDVSDTHAYRLINAAKIVEQVSPIGGADRIAPKESHTRELARLPENVRADSWQEILDTYGDKPTAKQVAEYVDQWLDSELQDDEPTSFDTVETSRPQESTSFEGDALKPLPDETFDVERAKLQITNLVNRLAQTWPSDQWIELESHLHALSRMMHKRGKQYQIT